MPSVREILHFISKKWAFTVAGILCFMILALLAASCGVDYYFDKGHGNFPVSTDPLPFFEYEIKEYLFHLEATFTINGVKVLDESCDYADGQCDIRDGVEWDLTEYQATYIVILIFSILAMIMAVVHGIFLQVLNWKTNLSTTLARILTIVSVVTALMLLVFILIAWALVWNHPEMARQASGFDKSTCDDLPTDEEDEEGVFCNWQGDLKWKDFQRAMPTFPNTTEVIYFYSSWGPSTAWILTTIAFGFAAWVNLLTYGWRPGFKG